MFLEVDLRRANKIFLAASLSLLLSSLGLGSVFVAVAFGWDPRSGEVCSVFPIGELKLVLSLIVLFTIVPTDSVSENGFPIGAFFVVGVVGDVVTIVGVVVLVGELAWSTGRMKSENKMLISGLLVFGVVVLLVSKKTNGVVNVGVVPVVSFWVLFASNNEDDCGIRAGGKFELAGVVKSKSMSD